MRRAARTDSNQAEIVAAFRSLGCSVFPLHQVGRGFPDLAVGCNGLNLLIEVKDGSKCPSARRLTADEQRFIEAWLGQVCVVVSVEDVRLVFESIQQGTQHEFPRFKSI